jgi:hypothetical protein
MRTKANLKNARLTNLISAASMNKIVGRDQFGTDDDLKEIGLLTMHFAHLEELLALYCEILLVRPELGGFHSVKPVAERRFSEKLDLYNMLVVAVGVLHAIKIDSIEETTGQARQIGERRNDIIHGYLHVKKDGEVVFRNRGSHVPADLNSLRALNSAVLQTEEAVAKAFTSFFKELVRIAPAHQQIEACVVKALDSHLAWMASTSKLRESRATARSLNERASCR